MRITKLANSLPGPIIEVGALFGLTTQLIATHKRHEKRLITIEDFSWNPFSMPPRDHRVFTERVLRYVTSHCNTEIFAGTNREFYRSYRGEQPSLVFVDADHSYAGIRQDLDWAAQMKVPIIAGHDYHPRFPGVVRAVDEAFRGDFLLDGSVWWTVRITESQAA